VWFVKFEFKFNFKFQFRWDDQFAGFDWEWG
jgi:hypothetical protein